MYLEAIDQVCLGGIGILLMGTITVFQFREMLFPRQLEVVVDEDSIRWSQMYRGSDQKTLPLCDIKSLHVNRAECEVFAETGRWFLCPIGEYLFYTDANFMAFLKFMTDQHPEIPIVIRM